MKFVLFMAENFVFTAKTQRAQRWISFSFAADPVKNHGTGLPAKENRSIVIIN
jgi:hypothetical protein